HNQTFKVSCKVEKVDEIFIGNGTSRRKAEQDAALQVIKVLGIK
ncbi:putative dsRNA-binding protein, partial [Glaesserella parasuis]